MNKYTISIPNPSDHFIQLELKLDKITQAVTRLLLPSWRPGRYELGNFSKNIRNWRAYDEKGRELAFKKTNKDCWEIQTKGQKSILIRYEYFANILNAGACWLDKDQLYVNGIHCFLYEEGRQEEPCEVTLNIPSGWKIACGLKEKKKHLLTARSFHELVDCPFIASSSLQHRSYDVDKISFTIWIQGECRPDWEKIVRDFKRFTEEQLRLFGTFPVKDYHYLIQVLPFSFYHGVEHTNSTVLAIGPGYDLMQKELYHELVGVACHELFHTWNVKTIRPVEMLPYKYQEENYSRLGYIYEGVTTYYGDYLLGRCGIYSDEEILGEFSKRLQSHMDNAGRFNYSVAESSFDSWLDGYVPGIPGRKTSIYDEGCLLALMLDLMIRRDTEGKKSLDDFMRMLDKNFGNLKKGYREEDLIGMLRKLTGRDFQQFFTFYVNKACSYERELGNLLDMAGCEIQQQDSPCYHEQYFGFKIIQEGAVTRVLKVYPGSVADQAGLFQDDEIISINGFKIENNLEGWCRYFDGNAIVLDVFSNKQHQKVNLEKDKVTYYSRYRIKKMQNTTRLQESFFEKWMGR